jgi:23S rRNA pseudouridine2605 synthase
MMPDDPGRAETAGPEAHPEGERLQKVLARTGLGSRRVCEQLIDAGRVTVNGASIALGARVLPGDEIAVDGSVISTMVDAATYLLNKPTGVITTAKDTHNRPTVLELVPPQPRVFPVGRLDLDTEGLLLLTNDGGLAHRLSHPRYGIDKEYLVHVRGRPSPAAVRSLREGVALDDGMTAPAKASIIGPGLLRLTIHEGRNRQVRRMCEAIGHPVLRLVRTRIGPLSDPRLSPGSWRVVTPAELLDLQRAVTLVDPEAEIPTEIPAGATSPITSDRTEADNLGRPVDGGTDAEPASE